MTLQYRASDGKLLYHTTGTNIGKLMSECCCHVPCNECEEELLFTYTVTLAGLHSHFDVYSGVHSVKYMVTPECYWKRLGDTLYTNYVLLYWYEDHWYLAVGTPEGCFYNWIGGEDPCDPTGSYSYLSCGPSDEGCQHACDDSVGATCVVS